jgi:predicted PurR-regulated permease PerM
MHGTQRSDRIVAITIAILLTAGGMVVLSPFVSALLWAVLLGCVTWPTWRAVGDTGGRDGALAEPGAAAAAPGLEQG